MGWRLNWIEDGVHHWPAETPPASPGGREGRSPRRGFRGEIQMRSSWLSLAGFGAAAPRRCCQRPGPWTRIETGSLASIRTRSAGSVDLTWCMILILVSCLKGVERRYLVLAIRRCDGCRRWTAVVPDLRNCFIAFIQCGPQAARDSLRGGS